MASGSRSQSCVLPSMSVKRKVTVPLGGPVIARYLCYEPFGASQGTRRPRRRCQQYSALPGPAGPRPVGEAPASSPRRQATETLKVCQISPPWLALRLEGEDTVREESAGCPPARKDRPAGR